jgi:hypothetical protein
MSNDRSTSFHFPAESTHINSGRRETTFLLRIARSILVSLAFASLSFASIVKFPGANVTYPNGQTNMVSGACVNFPGSTCTTTAYFSADSLDQTNGNHISGLFQEAFDAWNDANGDDWTLKFGGPLDGTLVVDPAAAVQAPLVANNCGKAAGAAVCGGLIIKVTLSGVTLPPLGDGDQLVWTQGLFLDSQDGNGIVGPYYEMDINPDCVDTGGPPNISCPPAYPYQSKDHHFYDHPQASYESPGSIQAFFNADAYLSVINYDTDTLTVYDGVSYGFQNYVTPAPSSSGPSSKALPEPSAAILTGAGLLTLVSLKRTCLKRRGRNLRRMFQG